MPGNGRYSINISHVWMWELDYKESWAPNKWCFWTVVLEKTLESPLDWQGDSVNPKGNQSWMFIGRTDAEAETPILWLPDGKNWLIWKDPDAGKDWRQEEKGTTKNKMVRWHHQLNEHEFEQALGVGDGQGSLVLQSMGSQRVRHDWVTELSWTEEPDGLQSMGLHRVRQDWMTNTFTFSLFTLKLPVQLSFSLSLCLGLNTHRKYEEYF